MHASGDGRRKGVGIIVSGEISKQVVRVERWEGRIVIAWVVVQRQVVCVMLVYGPQTGRTGAEKQELKDTLERMMGMVELGMMPCLVGDFNVHVGVAEPGEEECFGKFGQGMRNRECRAGGEEWDGQSWFMLSKVGKPQDYL